MTPWAGSGYIRIWKELRTSPEFRRLVRRFEQHLQGNSGEVGCREFAETYALGALAQLWLIADSHIRDDDTLDLGPDEIEDFLGICGVVEILGPNWAEVLGPHQVRLPNYSAHNGITTRKKALAAARSAKYRAKTRDVTLSGDAVTRDASRSRVTSGVTPPPIPSLPNPSQHVTQETERADGDQGIGEAREKIRALAAKLRADAKS